LSTLGVERSIRGIKRREKEGNLLVRIRREKRECFRDRCDGGEGEKKKKIPPTLFYSSFINARVKEKKDLKGEGRKRNLRPGKGGSGGKGALLY